MQTLKEGRRISIKSRRGEERTLRKEGRKKMLELREREKRAQRKKIEKRKHWDCTRARTASDSPPEPRNAPQPGPLRLNKIYDWMLY